MKKQILLGMACILASSLVFAANTAADEGSQPMEKGHMHHKGQHHQHHHNKHHKHCNCGHEHNGAE